MTDPLVVARLRNSDPSHPSFTRTGSIEELLQAVEEKIPVDLVYFIVPDPDGKGYSLREAGLIVIDILREGLQRLSTPPEPPAPVERTGFSQVLPLPPQPEFVTTTDFEAGDDDFIFSKPKSQAELLAERGLTGDAVTDQPAQKPAQKKARAKRGPAKQDSNDRDNPALPDDQLPNLVSNGGEVVVTGFSKATPAEEAAASHFQGFK